MWVDCTSPRMLASALLRGEGDVRVWATGTGRGPHWGYVLPSNFADHIAAEDFFSNHVRQGTRYQLWDEGMQPKPINPAGRALARPRYTRA